MKRFGGNSICLNEGFLVPARARTRLHEIHRYIAQDSPQRAERVVERLIRRSEALATEPRIDREVPEYPQRGLRQVLERPFRLIYRVNSDSIVILTVKHYRQRLPRRGKQP